MTISGTSTWPRRILLLAALACGGNWAAGQARSMRDRFEVSKLTHNMKTICLGRLLIDVPAKAEVALMRESIDGFDILTVEESEAEFRERIAAREIAIRAHASATDGTGGMLRAEEMHGAAMIGRSFAFGLNRGYTMKGDQRVDDEFVSVEAHAHTRGLSVVLSRKFAEPADGKLAETLLARLRPRGVDELPAEQGVCISRAIFAEPLPLRTTEHLGLHLRLPGHADLVMALYSMPGGDTARSLLARSARTDASDSLADALRVTKLRAARRNIGGLSGEEVLERYLEMNFATTFVFMWETPGMYADPMQPFLFLELQGGISPAPGAKPAGSSLHQDALLALWDAIASSIRLRPNRQPQAPSAAAADAGGTAPPT